MIRDVKFIYSDAQAVTTTADSTDILDHQAAGDALGEGNSYLVVKEGSTAFTGVGSSVTIALQTATDAAFSSPVTLYSKTVPVADYAANKEHVKVPLPTGLLRYSKIVYTVASGPLADGAFDAFIVANADEAGSLRA